MKHRSVCLCCLTCIYNYVNKPSHKWIWLWSQGSKWLSKSVIISHPWFIKAQSDIYGLLPPLIGLLTEMITKHTIALDWCQRLIWKDWISFLDVATFNNCRVLTACGYHQWSQITETKRLWRRQKVSNKLCLLLSVMLSVKSVQFDQHTEVYVYF